jgi:hypothetical protein
MASALEGFLRLECDEQLAGWLRAEVDAAQGVGEDKFDLFDVELVYQENRVTIAEAAALGYDNAQLTLAEFLVAIPDVPPRPRMPGRPKRVFKMPPASNAKRHGPGDIPLNVILARADDLDEPEVVRFD